MFKKLGELTIRKSDDYYEKIAKALEEAGFTLVVTSDDYFEKHYTIAIEDEES